MSGKCFLFLTYRNVSRFYLDWNWKHELFVCVLLIKTATNTQTHMHARLRFVLSAVIKAICAPAVPSSRRGCELTTRAARRERPYKRRRLTPLQAARISLAVSSQLEEEAE